MVKQARQFNPPDFTGTAVPTDSNGWPKADFSTILQSGFDKTGHVYRGTYKVSFNGQATLGRWVSPATIANQVYNPATNTTTLDVIFTPKDEGDWYLGLSFTNTRRTPDSAAGSGITNLPRYPPWLRPQHHAGLHERIPAAPGPVQRAAVHELHEHEQQPGRQLGRPRQPTEPRQSTNQGVAWEYVIDLANLTGKDLWVNVPGHATDDYVRNMAALFKQRLDPGRVVYLEYANEVWNYQFDQAQYNLAAAKAEVYAGTSNLNNDNTTSTGLWAYRRHGRRTKEVGEIFASVFGPGSMNTPHPAGARGAVRQQRHGPPSARLAREDIRTDVELFVRGRGGAYFGTDGKELASGATPDDVLDGMESSVNKRNFRHPMFSGLASKFGLRSFAYEGGSATGGEEGLDLKTAALLDPRMKDVTVDYLNGWYGSGGELFEWFMAGPTNWTSPFGAWGLTNSVDNLQSPKVLGTVAVAEGPKVAQTAGVMIPGQVDARYHTNAVATNLAAAAGGPVSALHWHRHQFDYVVRAPRPAPTTSPVSAAAPSSGKTIDVYLNDRSPRTLAVPSNGTTNDFEKFVDSEPMALLHARGRQPRPPRRPDQPAVQHRVAQVHRQRRRRRGRHDAGHRRDGFQQRPDDHEQRRSSSARSTWPIASRR